MAMAQRHAAVSFSLSALGSKLVIRSSVLLVAVMLLSCPGQGQTRPSLQEIFEWITNTLRPAEGNNTVIHRPFSRPYSKDWVKRGIDPYRLEVITKFSHDGCNVQSGMFCTNAAIAV